MDERFDSYNYRLEEATGSLGMAINNFENAAYAAKHAGLPKKWERRAAVLGKALELLSKKAEALIFEAKDAERS